MTQFSAVAPPAPRPAVAAFDVDGTLTTRDCVVPFLRRVAGPRRLAIGLGRDARRIAPDLVRRDRDALKAHAARITFAGRPYADVEAAGREFAAHVLHAWLRPDVVDRLVWHRRAGHHAVLVSASFGVYLRPLAEWLEVDGVVATELAVDGEHCTGGLEGGNCRGAAKVRRLHAYLDEHIGGRRAVDLWAYGDSPGDGDLLADADHAIWATAPLSAVPLGAA
jgi:phosphatidylglycerophosphatase C